ncbi:hypothetical protein GW575_00080 [Campylobacter sp. MIT 19-121]|uniref:hypothetical protein n=1 Tax=Campylobacter sp. MIT 19-121 TaxID=2703906 RepID=UPI001389BA72|nr:hypothetical protein [Campylobacter sp. MIT 19-121]NDJ26354.1 hypothetical protein [Campylobacter sp. MIT 19-121]
MPDQNQTPNLSLDEQLLNALKENANFKEQVKMTLFCVNEVYQVFESLENEYLRTLEALKNKQNETQSLLEDFRSEKDAFNEALRAQKSELEANLNEVRQKLELTSTLKNELESLKNEVQADFEAMDAYKNDIEVLIAKLGNLQELKNEIENKKELAEQTITELEGKKEQILAFANNLKNQALALYESKIAELKLLHSELELNLTQKQSELETKQEEVFQSLETKKEQTKSEVSEFVSEQFDRLNQHIASLKESLDELDFVSAKEPANARLENTWLDLNEAVVKKYIQNPAISFFSAGEPEYFARLDDAFYKNDTDELFLFLNDIHGNNWHKINQTPFRADFQCQQKPVSSDTNPIKAGQTWFKMDYLELFYRENESWVQISKKLEQVRFEQDDEPSLNVKLNDIWKKGEEFFLYVSVNENDTLVQKWIALEKAYLHAKFFQMNEPINTQASAGADEVLVNMFDLWFKGDEREVFVYQKVGQNYDFVRLDESKQRARFQGESAPDELLENDLWFHHQADNIYEGELKSYTGTASNTGFLSLKACLKYARFHQELEPKTANAGDLLFKPYSNELYYYFVDSNVAMFKKINLEGSFAFEQDDEPENANFADVWKKGDELFIFVRFYTNFEWRVIEPNGLLPYIFVNEHDKRLKIIERLILPDESLPNKYKELLEIKYPQQLTNKAFVDKTKAELSSHLHTAKTELQTNITNTYNRYNYDWVNNANNNASIDFRKGINFKLNLTSNQALRSVSVDGCEGKSGMIFVNGANRITGFNAPFNWRISQSNFNSWELFSYGIINGVIRLVRS